MLRFMTMSTEGIGEEGGSGGGQVIASSRASKESQVVEIFACERGLGRP